MRALVTGGAGFIGSTLVDRLLAEGHAVDVVDDLSGGSLANLNHARSIGGSFSFHHLDVRAPEIVALFAHRNPDVVFHLAGNSNVGDSIDRPYVDAEVNVLGSLRVLEGARAAGCEKVVFAASGGLRYANDGSPALRTESSPREPRAPLGVANEAVIEYLRIYRELYGLEFTALALGNVYGPRQDPSSGAVVVTFARNLVAARPCTIHGDGSQTRDFVYVDDAVDAFARAAVRGSGLVVNVGSGVATSIRSLHALMADRHGSYVAPRSGRPRPFERRAPALDSTRARIHLGWTPWTSLADGVDTVLSAFEHELGERVVH